MSAREKSDLPEVARKRANKAASAAAEPVERRGGAKENAELQSTVRTQSREAVSRAQARIREAVTRNRQDELARRFIDLGPVAPVVRRQRHHRIVQLGRDHQHAIDRLFRPLPPLIKGVLFLHHKSSPSPPEEGMPHLALCRFGAILDLRQQLRLDPDMRYHHSADTL